MHNIQKVFVKLCFNLLRQSSHCERRKVVVLGSGWGALSFVRKLDPSAFDATWKSDKLHQFARGCAWLRVVTCGYTFYMVTQLHIHIVWLVWLHTCILDVLPCVLHFVDSFV
jgi:hypothetical protein